MLKLLCKRVLTAAVCLCCPIITGRMKQISCVLKFCVAEINCNVNTSQRCCCHAIAQEGWSSHLDRFVTALLNRQVRVRAFPLTVSGHQLMNQFFLSFNKSHCVRYLTINDLMSLCEPLCCGATCLSLQVCCCYANTHWVLTLLLLSFS